LDCKAAAQLPDQLPFIRNGRKAEARRVQVGEIEVASRELSIADAAYGDKASPLSDRMPDGRHVVHAYVWDHPRGPINICAVVTFARQRLAITRRLVITNDLRPDLTAGIIVDSAEVRIGGTSGVILPSGLGDGYYPIVGVYNFGLFVQALVLDFEVWRTRNVILLPGQEFDEFGIVRQAAP